MSREKKTVSIVMLLITASLALGVTWLTWQHTTNNLSWTMMDNPESYNATSGVTDSVFNIMPTVLGIAAALVVITIVLSWLHFPKEQIENNKYLQWFLSSVYYFVYGILGMVCFLPPFMLGYFLYDYLFIQGNTGSVTFIGQTLVLIIVAYFVIAGFGYFFKHMIYDKIAEKWEELHPVDEQIEKNGGPTDCLEK